MDAHSALATRLVRPPFLWSFFLLFVLFSTADQLHYELFLFKIKISHSIAIAFALYTFYRYRAIPFPKMLSFITILIFSSITVSAYLGSCPLRSIGYSFVFLFELICYFLPTYLVFFFEDHQKLLKTIITAALLVALHATAQLLLSLVDIHDPFVRQKIFGLFARPNSWLYEPSYYALFLSPFVFGITTYALLNQNASFLLAGLFHLFFLLSTATSAWFSYFFYLPILSFITLLTHSFSKISSRALRPILIFSFFLCLGYLLFSNIFEEYYFKFFSKRFFLHHSFAERFEGIERAWSAFIAHPFFGVGIGGIGPYISYKEDGGPNGAIYSLADFERFDATNVASEILGSLGLFGGFSFIAFAVYLIHSAAVAHRKASAEKRLQIIAIVVAVILEIVVLQINQGLFRNYIWISIGIFLGICHTTKGDDSLLQLNRA